MLTKLNQNLFCVEGFRRLRSSSQETNVKSFFFLLTCLSLLHSSSYVTRSALSTQTHYQQTRYESSALLPPPDPAVNPPPPPFNPSLPAWAASVNLFALPWISNDPVFPRVSAIHLLTVSVTQNRLNLPRLSSHWTTPNLPPKSTSRQRRQSFQLFY